jgi:hypothetical protein
MSNLVVGGEGVDVTISPEKFARIASGMGWLPPDEAEKLRQERDEWKAQWQFRGSRIRHAEEKIAALERRLRACDSVIKSLGANLAAAKAQTSEEARAVLDHVTNFDEYQMKGIVDAKFPIMAQRIAAYRASLKREPAASVEKPENLTYDEAKAAWESGKWVVPMRDNGWNWNPEARINGIAVEMMRENITQPQNNWFGWSEREAPFRIHTLRR